MLTENPSENTFPIAIGGTGKKHFVKVQSINKCLNCTSLWLKLRKRFCLIAIYESPMTQSCLLGSSFNRPRCTNLGYHTFERNIFIVCLVFATTTLGTPFLVCLHVLISNSSSIRERGRENVMRKQQFLFHTIKMYLLTDCWRENKQLKRNQKLKNKTPNHMIHSKNWQNNRRFGHQQNVTKQQTTAIISKLTFRVTQIRILSHFSSCHALFATPNLDASAVLLLRLSRTPENKKKN